ncbi:MAG TPA: hypothetical protein VFZ41_02135 [Solirubrobacterales bacterium]
MKVTLTMATKVNGRGRFFFGRRASNFFTGRFTTRRKVKGRVGIDLSQSSCPGRGVHEVLFRARRVRALR